LRKQVGRTDHFPGATNPDDDFAALWADLSKFDPSGLNEQKLIHRLTLVKDQLIPLKDFEFRKFDERAAFPFRNAAKELRVLEKPKVLIRNCDRCNAVGQGSQQRFRYQSDLKG
jgi:hypothetical protein